MSRKFNRRELLTLAAGGVVLPEARRVYLRYDGTPGQTRYPDYGSRRDDIGTATADEDPSCFSFSRFRFHQLHNVLDQWDINTFCDEELLKFVATNTNIRLSQRSWGQRVVGVEDLRTAHADPTGSKIGKHPFLFMMGEAAFAFDRIESEALGEFFRRGGFLYCDDCVGGGTGDHFFRACLERIPELLPDAELLPVPHDHAIYHCFFDLPNGAPVCQGTAHQAHGLFHKDRIVAFMTPGDIHCGWWTPYFGEELATQSYRMATNIIIYSLTH